MPCDVNIFEEESHACQASTFLDPVCTTSVLEKLTESPIAASSTLKLSMQVMNWRMEPTVKVKSSANTRSKQLLCRQWVMKRMKQSNA
eukprot:1705690-Amphidinium_carterae.1